MLLQKGGGSVWTTGWGETGRLGSGALNREKIFVKAMGLGEVLGTNYEHKNRRSLVQPIHHILLLTIYPRAVAQVESRSQPVAGTAWCWGCSAACGPRVTTGTVSSGTGSPMEDTPCTRWGLWM